MVKLTFFPERIDTPKIEGLKTMVCFRDDKGNSISIPFMAIEEAYKQFKAVKALTDARPTGVPHKTGPVDMVEGNHSICEECWNKLDPGSREGLKVPHPEKVDCCFCGKETEFGMYVQAEGKNIHCRDLHKD